MLKHFRHVHVYSHTLHVHCIYIHVYIHVHVYVDIHVHVDVHVHVRQLIFSRKSDCLGCAVLLCLVCLFDFACFFLSSHLSFV